VASSAEHSSVTVRLPMPQRRKLPNQGLQASTLNSFPRGQQQPPRTHRPAQCRHGWLPAQSSDIGFDDRAGKERARWRRRSASPVVDWHHGGRPSAGQAKLIAPRFLACAAGRVEARTHRRLAPAAVRKLGGSLPGADCPRPGLEHEPDVNSRPTSTTRLGPRGNSRRPYVRKGIGSKMKPICNSCGLASLPRSAFCFSVR
jgi:hypothetical protein